MIIQSLPEPTRLVFQALPQELLKGFLLVGGSALALRLGHRKSEDIDLAYVGRLPLDKISAILKTFETKGSKVTKLPPPPKLEDDCANSGDDPDTVHQRHVIDGVKCDFFVLNQATEAVIPLTADVPFRVAEIGELWAIKSLLVLERMTKRDQFDLYYLMAHQGYTAQDFNKVYKKADRFLLLQDAWNRMTHPVFQKSDPGLELLVDSSPDPQEIARFFQKIRGAQ